MLCKIRYIYIFKKSIYTIQLHCIFCMLCHCYSDVNVYENGDGKWREPIEKKNTSVWKGISWYIQHSSRGAISHFYLNAVNYHKCTHNYAYITMHIFNRHFLQTSLIQNNSVNFIGFAIHAIVCFLNEKCKSI